MNFAIFNSVLKSVYFPPNNPWLSGYYLNYYYYGYVLAAIPTKILGIMPSFAFNLVLPTWFAMTGVGVFSGASNLAVKLLGERKNGEESLVQARLNRLAWAAGLSGVVLMLILGNLFQVRQLWEKLPEVANPALGEELINSNHLRAFLSGAGQVITGQADLPGAHNDWYFDSSRPHFQAVDKCRETLSADYPPLTYHYRDLHPHLLVMPIWIAALGWLL